MFKQGKRMSGKQVFAAVIAVLLLLMTLAGCGGDAGTRESDRDYNSRDGRGATASAVDNSPPPAVRWEYDVIIITDRGARSSSSGRDAQLNPQPIIDTLNERAEEGWELVTYVIDTYSNYVHHVLTVRRRLP